MRLALFVSLALAFATPAYADSIELLTNGDAETGDLSGWSTDYSGTTGTTSAIDAVTSQLQSGPTVTPNEGAYFFSFARAAIGASSGSANVVSMFQTGSGLSAAGGTLDLGGDIQIESDDFGVATISIFNSSGVLLDSATTGNIGIEDGNAWTDFSLSLDYGTDAASWRLDLTGTNNASTFANTFWDDLSLTSTPVPEPGTLALLGVGMLGLAYQRRRKMKAKAS